MQHNLWTEADNVKPRGYIIPLCTKKTIFQRDKLLLVGDAAGLADPFSGEGIYNAIRSGHIAAEVIANSERKGLPVEKYTHMLRSEILPELKRAKILNSLFYPRSAILHRVLHCRQKVALDLLGTLFGDRSYKGIFWRNVRNVL